MPNNLGSRPAPFFTGAEDELEHLASQREAISRQLGLILKNKSASSSEVAEVPLSKKDKKKQSKEEEKLEKRRIKEEERLKRLTEKKKKKQKSSPELSDYIQSPHNLVPLFVQKSIEFIEAEGLDAEGIYRVPGNRAHVDLLFQKFDEGLCFVPFLFYILGKYHLHSLSFYSFLLPTDASVNIHELDIPVNAVATALKDFVSKRLPPIIPVTEMDQLTDVATFHDHNERLVALRDLVQSLPPVNFQVLKFIFRHFVRISENSRINSMDSKNLAICWWPTLLPLEFNDMLMFERMRPHLEQSIQTMIDQYSIFFEDEVKELVV